jgi:hypothetical protein
VSKGSLTCSILLANEFAVLGTLKSLDVPIPDCNEEIITVITEVDLQLSQPPCFVHAVPELVKDECSPFKKKQV